MSTNLSRLVQTFVTSVVVGKDVVPRVSVVNLGRLIDQMVNPFNDLSFVNGLQGRCAWPHSGAMLSSGQALQKPIRCSQMPKNSPGRHVVQSASVVDLGHIIDHMVTTANTLHAHRIVSILSSRW